MLISVAGWSQSFPAIGQTPGTAFPVCATDTFKQATVPFGSSHLLQVPRCGKYPDVNPFWYSFTCYVGGTLGFLIRPNNLGDDYDWMLFDITGHKPTDVFTNVSLVVIGNWAGTYGLTGARAGGSANTQCGSDPRAKVPTFSKMPTLIQGHKYLLLISHFTNTQSGYSLTFGGGTAVIKDPKLPDLLSASTGCNKAIVKIVLNKGMRCNSLADDGSDFSVASNPVSVIGATGYNCNGQFDMDSIQLFLSAPLPPGTYSILAKTGTDGNTLLDDCGNQLAVGASVSFTIEPPVPTPVDSLTTPDCAPKNLQLVFSDRMQCSSIAPDGSDFTVTGTSVVSVSGASGICSGVGLTSVINISLSSPVVVGGNYLITLKSGSDGNTILNECGIPTPAGASISFSTKDTVSADFGYSEALGCRYDTIQTFYTNKNGIDDWQWNIDSTYNSTETAPAIYETVFGPKNLQHIVSNGFCTDTVTKIINLDNVLQADFQGPDEVCPKDLFAITNNSVGHVVSWSWNFGDGVISDLPSPPPHLFPDTWAGKTYSISLVIQNDLGCADTLKKQVTKLQSCFITVPNAFTPNGDGKNDYLYPLNAFSATNLQFMVYNRFGQLLFESHDFSQKWDGTIHGKPQPAGAYIWTLRYTDGASGKIFSLKGSSVLVR